MTPKSPQEKKRLSYLHDRRIGYGESNKGSRKILPRRKATQNRAHRTAVSQILHTAINSAPNHDDLIMEAVETGVRNLRRQKFHQFPGTPLAEHIQKQLAGRVGRFGRKPARGRSTPDES